MRTAGVVVHARLGEHGVVLNLRLLGVWAVAADDHELGCSRAAHASHCRLQRRLGGALSRTRALAAGRACAHPCQSAGT